MMKEKIQKYLFTIDLDGTLLKNSATSEIDERDIQAIANLMSQGHIVCIITGRPWRSTSKAYHTLKLNTLVSNYNGAYIHNPKDIDFVPTTTYMNLTDVMYIIGDQKIQEAKSNWAIQGPNWVMLDKRDKDLERVFGFSKAKKFVIGIDIHRLPLRPTGVVFDTKKGTNILELKDYLQRTYGDLVEFSSWSKGEGKTPVFDMTAVGVTKAKALALMARFYKIPMNRTVAIGDGYNDLSMFDASEISVSMANSSDDIKKLTTYSTKRTCKDAGVAEFINKFLGKDQDKFIKKQKLIRKKLRNISEQIVPAH